MQHWINCSIGPMHRHGKHVYPVASAGYTAYTVGADVNIVRQDRRSASTSTVIASEGFGSNATVSRVRGGGEYLFTMGSSHWTVICIGVV